jgi:hypothetical protein
VVEVSPELVEEVTELVRRQVGHKRHTTVFNESPGVFLANDKKRIQVPVCRRAFVSKKSAVKPLNMLWDSARTFLAQEYPRLKPNSAVVLRSDPGNVQQASHCDFHIDDSFRAWAG